MPFLAFEKCSYELIIQIGMMIDLSGLNKVLFGRESRYIWTFSLWFWLYIYYFDKSCVPFCFLVASAVLVSFHQATIDYQINKLREGKTRDQTALKKLVTKNVLKHPPTLISIFLMSMLYFLTIITIGLQYFTEPSIGYALFFVGTAGFIYLLASYFMGRKK